MKIRQSNVRIWSAALAPLALVIASCTTGTEKEPSVATATSALSAAQCDYFEANGKVTICHATGSATNPIVVLRVAEAACVNAHSGHAGDRIAVDGDCGPDACLPQGAPHDGTVPCCRGFAAVGGICTDVNECATADVCGVGASCANTIGSYTCSCNSGYTGASTTGAAASCTDINECATGNGGCDPLTICTNTPGSRTCGSCPSGYTGTGATGCTDINECATGNGGCDALTTCTNTPGSRTCGACPSGYTGSGDTGCTRVLQCPPTPTIPTCSWNVGAQASVNELSGVVANPTGAWSYFYGPSSSGSGTLTEYVAAPQILYSASDHINDWYSNPASPGTLRGYWHDFGASVPMVVSNVSPNPSGVITAYGAHVNFAELLYHPGPPGSGGRYNTIRFTAPAAGTYAVEASWRIAHSSPVDFAILKNHALPALAVGRSPATVVQSLALTAGETLDFALGFGNDFGSTTTGIGVKVHRTDPACATACADANNNGVCDEFDIMCQ